MSKICSLLTPSLVDKQHHERFGQRFLVHLSQTGEIEAYFEEFEACDSAAAQITHEADGLECRVQAVEYILRYPQFKELLQFLEFTPQLVYLQDLTDLLSKEEISLREKQSELTIIFVTGTLHQKPASSYLLANFIRRPWRRQRYSVCQPCEGARFLSYSYWRLASQRDSTVWLPLLQIYSTEHRHRVHRSSGTYD